MNILFLCTILGTGLVSGVFFAFSTFVMGALARITPSCGIAAMQSINQTVVNRWFLGAFLGTTGLCLTALITCIFEYSTRSNSAIMGSLCYLSGTFGVTIIFNIPMNKKLEAPTNHEYWQIYLKKWTFWNHIRTLAAGIACICFIMSQDLSAGF